MKKLIFGVLTVGLVLILAGSLMAGIDQKPSVTQVTAGQPVQPPDWDTRLVNCPMAKTNGTIASYWSAYSLGTRTVTFFDPANFCAPVVYPYEITDLSFSLYDPGGYQWPVQLDVVVFDMADPNDFCAGPGAELCRVTVSCDQALFMYPTVGTVTFPSVCCVNGPFFIGVEYTDQGPGPFPSVSYDGQVATVCDNWMFYVDGQWYEWNSFWAPPVPGYPLFWVGGETPPNNCEQADCQNHKMHFPQLPDPYGWDVNATAPISLADDWQCTETGMLEDIHWWGSWRHDDIGTIEAFIITIHDNIPVGPNGWSVPGNIVCGPIYIQQGEFTTTLMDPSPQGWYDPVQGEVFPPPDHQQYFRYDYFLPEPCVQTVDEIYWLRISAVVVDPVNTHWGWKSTQDHWMDDAVWGPIPDAPLPPEAWIEIYEPGGGGGPIVNSFWVGMDDFGQIIPPFSGGTDYYPGPGGINGWFWYPSGWWNIWFYNAPLDFNRYKEISILGTVWKLDPIRPAWVEIAINWSGPEWPPEQPPPTEPTDEVHIERFPVLLSDLANGYEIFEFFGFIIEEYNPEWVSVDVRGYNFVIWDSEPGIIEHECLPSSLQSLDLSFCITSEPVQETGACCFPDERMCENLLEPECDTQGGVFLGAGTACQGDLDGNGIDEECEPVLGACCWPSGLCTLETQANCENNGGTFYLGQSCVEVDCGGGQDIPTLSEWGMIILGLLLLTAGTVAVVRRRKAASARAN